MTLCDKNTKLIFSNSRITKEYDLHDLVIIPLVDDYVTIDGKRYKIDSRNYNIEENTIHYSIMRV